MHTEELIAALKKDVEDAGRKAGIAGKNKDMRLVEHWKRTLINLRPIMKKHNVDADVIFNEAYKEVSGFYTHKFVPFI